MDAIHRSWPNRMSVHQPDHGVTPMKGTRLVISVGMAAALAVLGAGAAISAQDRYALKVPGGLAFSEFRGYERWQVISVSENGGRMAVILGNPAMIDAFKA